MICTIQWMMNCFTLLVNTFNEAPDIIHVGHAMRMHAFIKAAIDMHIPPYHDSDGLLFTVSKSKFSAKHEEHART